MGDIQCDVCTVYILSGHDYYDVHYHGQVVAIPPKHSRRCILEAFMQHSPMNVISLCKLCKTKARFIYTTHSKSSYESSKRIQVAF